MKRMRLVTSAAVLLLAGGCMDGRAVPDPLAPGSALPSAAAGRTAVEGEFAALVDFSTITLTPRGKNCRLEVAGRLVFSGSIVGEAVGTTSALVFAPCSEVATTPPGTYADVFRSDLEFEGTVNGEPATAHVAYQGRVQPGGAIEGMLQFSRGVSGVLEVDSRVAVGGTYRGSVVVH